MNKEHFRKLERMYLEANIQKELYESTTIKIEHKRTEIGMMVSDKYFHALNGMHGSVYFKLLDDAAFFAVNSVISDVCVLTTSFNINLVRPVGLGKIHAVGELRFQSRNLFVAEAQLFNEAGKEVAFGTGHFAKSKVVLSEEIGYT
ncbi:MAG: PaaI family thioesterase [Calditrichia bacterium]